MIKESFLRKCFNRVHPKVSEFLFKATQMLIVHLFKTNPDPFSPQTTLSLTTLMRFMVALVGEPMSPFDEDNRSMPEFKNPMVDLFIFIAEHTQDVTLLTLSLRAVYESRTKSMPMTTQSHKSKKLI